MAACQDLEHWFTKELLVPVTRFIYESQQACEQVKEWVKETVYDRVEEFISRQEQFCRDLPWPLSWICDVVIIIEKIITYVPRTISKLIINTVCKVIVKVIGSFVELVLSVVTWCITVTVCVFVDPLGKLMDLLRIIADTMEALLDVIIGAVDTLIELVDDFGQLLDSIGDTLGFVGWLLAPWKAIAKLANVLLNGARDFTDGVKEAFTGVINLSPCAVLRGLSDIGMAVVMAGVNTGFIVLSPVKALGMVFAGGRDAVDRWHLNQIIVDSINSAFGAGSARAARSISSLALGSTIAGRKFTIAPYRMYLSSRGRGMDLRALHESGIINLYALAGYWSAGCPGGLDQPEGEVVYADSPRRVSFSDIRRYLENGPEAAPEFWVFAITVERFKQHIELARRKSTAIGVQYGSMAMGVYRAHSDKHVPLVESEQENIFGELGRNGTTDDLSVIPVVSHFHYLPNPKKNGLASAFRPSRPGAPRPYVKRSGVTYRNHSPDWVFRWTLVHELGHYVGLRHAPWGFQEPNGIPEVKRSLDEIMFTPDTGEIEPGAILFEYLVAGGEPRFTVGDIRETWNWITRDGSSLLP